MPPESGGICGRLTYDFPLGCLQGGVGTHHGILCMSLSRSPPTFVREEPRGQRRVPVSPPAVLHPCRSFRKPLREVLPRETRPRPRGSEGPGARSRRWHANRRKSEASSTFVQDDGLHAAASSIPNLSVLHPEPRLFGLFDDNPERWSPELEEIGWQKDPGVRAGHRGPGGEGWSAPEAALVFWGETFGGRSWAWTWIPVRPTGSMPAYARKYPPWTQH